MKKFTLILAAASLLAATAAFGQATVLPRWSTSTPGSDLIQIIPQGNVGTTNVYQTVSQILTGTTNASGLNGFTLPFTTFKNSDGTTLAASAASGKFGLAITAGTSEDLLTEAANSNTKTDVVGVEIVLPASYVAGTNITVTANCNYTLGSGTVGTHTLASAAYLIAADGTEGTTLIATTAQTVPAAAGTVAFAITGTGLVPGSRLWLTFTLAIQDTGGANIVATVNSVKLS